jgi:transcription antitermination factor NusG
MMAVQVSELRMTGFSPVQQPELAPPAAPDWFVVLTEPQQEIPAVWRLHELELELFVPVVRKRVKTGRTGRNGQKVTRIIPKPMFPGYGFIRALDGISLDGLKAVRGVRDFLKARRPGYNDPQPVRLPHQAVMSVFSMQMKQQHQWIQETGGGRRAHFKRGDRVRVDIEGGAYAGLMAEVDKVDGKGRIQLLFGMIRHTLPADMVVAV